MFEGFFGEGRVGRVRGEGRGGGGGDEGSVVLADLRGEEGAELAVRAGVGSQCVDCQMMAMAEADTRRVSCNGRYKYCQRSTSSGTHWNFAEGAEGKGKIVNRFRDKETPKTHIFHPTSLSSSAFCTHFSLPFLSVTAVGNSPYRHASSSSAWARFLPSAILASYAADSAAGYRASRSVNWAGVMVEADGAVAAMLCDV